MACLHGLRQSCMLTRRLLQVGSDAGWCIHAVSVPARLKPNTVLLWCSNLYCTSDIAALLAVAQCFCTLYTQYMTAGSGHRGMHCLKPL